MDTMIVDEGAGGRGCGVISDFSQDKPCHIQRGLVEGWAQN